MREDRERQGNLRPIYNPQELSAVPRVTRVNVTRVILPRRRIAESTISVPASHQQGLKEHKSPRRTNKESRLKVVDSKQKIVDGSDESEST